MSCKDFVGSIPQKSEPPRRLRESLLADLAGLTAMLSGLSCPPVLLVVASEESLLLLFTKPQREAPRFFTAGDNGKSWSINRSDIHSLYLKKVGKNPWPLLSTLGYHTSYRTLVLGNLGQFRSLTFAGERADVRSRLESIALELACSPFAEGVEVTCLRFGESLSGLGGVTVADRLCDVMPVFLESHGLAERSERRLEPASLSSALHTGEARCDSTGRSAALCVLALDPHPQDRKLLERLYYSDVPCLVAVGESGLSFGEGDPSAKGASGPSSRLGSFSVSGDRLCWEAASVELRHATPLLSSRCLAAYSRLGDSPSVLDQAPCVCADQAKCVCPESARPKVATEMFSSVRPISTEARRARQFRRILSEWGSVELSENQAERPRGTQRLQPSADPAGTRKGAVDVSVLGVVRISGLAEDAISARTVALICYLALQREGATADELGHWLWGRKSPPPQRALSNALYRARVALGNNPEGSPYLPRVSPSGVYRLSSEVTNDLRRFERWLGVARQAAREQESKRAVAFLTQGLSLVRGVPFSGCERGSLFAWADLSLRNHAECLIDSASHELADLALGLSDFETARWSICKGLLVTPGCEECYRRRFLVAFGTGRRFELRESMRELRRALADPEDSEDMTFDVSPELQAMHRELMKAR